MLRMGCCMGASHGGLLRSECHMGALTCHMCVTCAVSDLDRVALNSMTYGSPDSAGGALDGKEGGVYIYACVGATCGEARCCPHLPRPPRRPRPFSVIPPFLPSFSPLPPSRRPRSVCWGSGAPSTLPSLPPLPPPAPGYHKVQHMSAVGSGDQPGTSLPPWAIRSGARQTIYFDPAQVCMHMRGGRGRVHIYLDPAASVPPVRLSSCPHSLDSGCHPHVISTGRLYPGVNHLNRHLPRRSRPPSSRAEGCAPASTMWWRGL